MSRFATWWLETLRLRKMTNFLTELFRLIICSWCIVRNIFASKKNTRQLHIQYFTTNFNYRTVTIIQTTLQNIRLNREVMYLNKIHFRSTNKKKILWESFKEHTFSDWDNTNVNVVNKQTPSFLLHNLLYTENHQKVNEFNQIMYCVSYWDT